MPQWQHHLAIGDNYPVCPYYTSPPLLHTLLIYGHAPSQITLCHCLPHAVTVHTMLTKAKRDCTNGWAESSPCPPSFVYLRPWSSQKGHLLCHGVLKCGWSVIVKQWKSIALEHIGGNTDRMPLILDASYFTFGYAVAAQHKVKWLKTITHLYTVHSLHSASYR